MVAEEWSSLIYESWKAGGFNNFKIFLINFKNFLIIINAWQMLFCDPEILWAVILKRGQNENKNYENLFEKLIMLWFIIDILCSLYVMFLPLGLAFLWADFYFRLSNRCILVWICLVLPPFINIFISVKIKSNLIYYCFDLYFLWLLIRLNIFSYIYWHFCILVFILFFFVKLL